MSSLVTDALLEARLLQLLGALEPGKSICPSEVPRAITGEGGPWRSYLKRTRAIAGRLSESGKVCVLRHGKPVKPDAIRGVVRLARGPRFED